MNIAGRLQKSLRVQRALASEIVAKPHIFVISIQKTATQSVYFALRDGFGAAARTFHAHSFDVTEINPADWEAKFRSDDTDMLQKWSRRAREQMRVLHALADTRLKKTIVTIRRDPVSRLYSALFHSRRPVIERHYDPETQRLRMEELNGDLEPSVVERVLDEIGYFDRVFAPLGVPREAVTNPFSIAQVRPDLEVASLRFEALAEDFARLVAHMGRPDLSLLHVNAAHDRLAGDGATAAFEKQLYAVFRRDFEIPNAALRALEGEGAGV